MSKFTLPERFTMPESSMAHWKMVLLRYFERIEIERKDRMLNEAQLSAFIADRVERDSSVGKPADARRVRTEVWLRDSLLWTLEEIERGEYTHALRGLLQAAGYAGMVGHDSQTGDCFTCLKNALESVCGYVERENAS